MHGTFCIRTSRKIHVDTACDYWRQEIFNNILSKIDLFVKIQSNSRGIIKIKILGNFLKTFNSI